LAHRDQSQRCNVLVASLIGHLGSSTFRLSTAACRCCSRARASLRNRHQGPSIMGFEDEAEQSIGRPCRQTNGGSKRPSELTSSIVPRGTSCHHAVELEFPPIAFDPAISCRYGFPGPAEFGAINPDAMHDHGQSTGQRHDRLLHPAAPGDLHCPRLEPAPFLRTQHARAAS
jgi:hypothetical protein